MNGLCHRRNHRRAARFTSLVLLSVCVSVAGAAEPVWLKLQAPRFGVVSQLDEEDTRKWAVEFDQFIDALHQLFTVDELALPPLTIVLFARPRDFAPYRYQTESGQANVSGFFANMDTWSVIGLAGRRSTSETRRIVYHEAVHWFASADDVEPPLWFEEGMAEVFSTFKVEDGKAIWGVALQEHVQYLDYVGLQSIEEFLRASQDEALHGSGRYYPQAWAFVHYLLFGNNGVNRSKLQAFLDQLRQTGLDAAFAPAFGRSYDEMTRDLRSYLQRGRYSLATQNVADRDREMTVEAASLANVQFALGRLAVAAGNSELAQRHADAVVTLAPNAAASFELFALLAQRANDAAALEEALDRAIELGSQDPNVYSTRAIQLIEDNRREDSRIDEMLAADTARTAADMFGRSIELRPRNRIAYEGLATALLNVDVVTEQDDAALTAGRRALPTNGLVLVGQAAVERRRGNTAEAMRLLRRSHTAPFDVPVRYRPAVTGLHDVWMSEWLRAELADLMAAERFTEAQAVLDEQLSDASITGQSRVILERLKSEVRSFERLHAAYVAMRDGRAEEARAALDELANDPNVSAVARRRARLLLDGETNE